MKIRFSIRDLLFLVVICALAVGWYLDRTTWKERYDSLIKGTVPTYVTESDGNVYMERTIRVQVSKK